MEDASVYQAIVAAAEEGRRVALATVIRTRGSVPRHAGSRMLVDPGRAPAHAMVGTIGGGCGEAEVIAAAHDVVSSGRARMVHVALTDTIEGWSPAVCGGTMDVLVEPILPTADS